MAQLQSHNVEVLFDDRRKVSPGVKFKDAELIGVPLVVVAGRETVDHGTLEIRDRTGEHSQSVPLDDASEAVLARIAELRESQS